MGRMADARKRARRQGGGEEPPPAPAPTPEGAEPAPSAPLAPPAEPEPADLVFPAEPAPAAPGRLQLPASGTAEEILAQAEAAGLGRDEPARLDPVAEAVAEVVSLVEPQRATSVSFFGAPAREERAAAEATEHLATFFLDREEYGVDVRLVQEIRRITEITLVPRAPDYIRGVINLRGRIIPVIDLKKKLALGRVGDDKASRIVVVKIADRLIGLLVDGASQVLRVPVSSVEAAPDEVVERGGDYIRGVAKLEKRLIILVDLHRILTLDHRDGASAP
jgi:purine-binding chemotaxis protein CheW